MSVKINKSDGTSKQFVTAGEKLVQIDAGKPIPYHNKDGSTSFEIPITVDEGNGKPLHGAMPLAQFDHVPDGGIKGDITLGIDEAMSTWIMGGSDTTTHSDPALIHTDEASADLINKFQNVKPLEWKWGEGMHKNQLLAAADANPDDIPGPTSLLGSVPMKCTRCLVGSITAGMIEPDAYKLEHAFAKGPLKAIVVFDFLGETAGFQCDHCGYAVTASEVLCRGDDYNRTYPVGGPAEPGDEFEAIQITDALDVIAMLNGLDHMSSLQVQHAARYTRYLERQNKYLAERYLETCKALDIEPHTHKQVLSKK